MSDKREVKLIAAPTRLAQQGSVSPLVYTLEACLRFVCAVAIALVAMSQLGCASTAYGRKFELAKVDQLTPGVSTVDDAVRLLGPPQAESHMRDNGKLLQWQYIQSSAFGGSGAHVAILFDAGGKMVRVTHKSASGSS